MTKTESLQGLQTLLESALQCWVRSPCCLRFRDRTGRERAWPPPSTKPGSTLVLGATTSDQNFGRKKELRGRFGLLFKSERAEHWVNKASALDPSQTRNRTTHRSSM